ncbi:MAG TPA: FkbM family methyltransferase, partial [Alphaproteobacteria bacterium]|nr:FkbM family methyltransferase [Alphaproteobacteria bacterium]
TYHTGPIHFINIDVEGAEKDVLQGLDLTNLRPWIIVIESTLPNTQVENHSNWEELLTISDYEFVYFDGLNRFYIAREQSYLKTAFNTPPNFFDNLITSKQLYLENKVQQTDIANKHLENELVVTQEKIELLSHHAGTLESELANERSAKEQFQTTLSETRKQLSKAESNIIKAKTRTAQVEANANRIESELASAREKIDLLNHHTGVLESELTYERRTQKELQSKLAEFQNQIVQLQESTNKWWSIAEQKSDTIKVIYASWSWRVTWPLRKLFDVLNWICKWLLLVIRLIVRLPVRFVSWFVLKAMVYAINRDSLRIKLLNQVNKYPRLKARLFMIGHQKGLFNQSVNVIEQELQQHVEINANIDHLSPQAKNIYHDLKNAIEKSNKERI